MKIAIYGTGDRASYFKDKIAKDENIEIVYYVESKKNKEEFGGKKVICANQMQGKDFDFLVIATIQFNEIVDFLKCNYSQYNEIENKIKSYELFMDFYFSSQISDMELYDLVTLDCGIKYLTHCSDQAIKWDMKTSGKNYAEDTIQAFFDLTNRYCEVEQKGYFLDIGANIGTTAVYVKKIMNPVLKVIGFEAGIENYKLLKINSIINNVSDIECEHLGLGDENCDMFYHYVATNPGGSSVGASDNATETVQIQTLDDYIERKQLRDSDISYLWIDTEGFEAKIVIGAKGLLKKKRIPLLQEYNYYVYKLQGVYEEYLDIIMSTYQKFVDVKEYCNGNFELFDISELKAYSEKLKEQTDILFF